MADPIDRDLDRQDAAREMERNVLAALLYERDAIFAVQDALDADDFLNPQHRLVYAAIRSLAEDQIPPDLVNVTEWLDRRMLLEQAGGHALLADLLTRPVVAVHVGWYASSVRDAAQLRRLVQAGSQIVRLAFESHDAAQAITQAQGLLGGLASRSAPETGATYAEAIGSFLAELELDWAHPERRDVLPTGLRDLDRGLAGGGFERGQLVIVAGRPGMAKSAFMLQLAHNMARRLLHTQAQPGLIAIFSSEMTVRQLLLRAVAEASGLDTKLIRVGALDENQRRLLRERAERLRHLPIWLSDRSRPTMSSIRATVERLRLEHDVRCVMFDYLEQAGEEGRGAASEELRISRAVAEMKALAKDANLTSVALSQINRSVEERADKHPSLSDLRYSGRIEAEADIVLALTRQDYYEALGKVAEADLDPTLRGTCEIDALKQREGEQRRYVVKFNPATATFANLDDPS